MRDPKRIARICKILQMLWVEVPDQRLGQLLENYVYGCNKAHVKPNQIIAGGKYGKIIGSCIHHVEDDYVLDKLEKTYKRILEGKNIDKENKKPDTKSNT